MELSNRPKKTEAYRNSQKLSPRIDPCVTSCCWRGQLSGSGKNSEQDRLLTSTSAWLTLVFYRKCSGNEIRLGRKPDSGALSIEPFGVSRWRGEQGTMYFQGDFGGARKARSVGVGDGGRSKMALGGERRSAKESHRCTG